MKRIFSLFFILLIFHPIYSQDKLTKLTYSIVDTSLTQTEQAREVYDWLIHNISYDVDQLRKGLRYYTPEQTLRRRKAVCYGYSDLFDKMCKILHIESYVIVGYSKGFGYVQGDNFIKSDHAWNIIFTDSSWKIIDATWGSGPLIYDYDRTTKIRQKYFNYSGIKTEVKFVRSPDMGYFNIEAKEVILTHFPIDSKWQFLDYPKSYITFITDSTDKSEYLNYQNEISFIRNKDTQDQIFMDALNSRRYNTLNNFDIASQYYVQANRLNIEHLGIDSINQYFINRSIDYCDSTLKFLKQYSTLCRHLYKAKKQKQISAYKPAKNSIRQVIKIPTKFNNRFSKALNKRIKLESIYQKWLLKVNLSDSLLPRKVAFSFDSLTTIDSLSFNEYTSKVDTYLVKASRYIVNLNNYKSKIENYYLLGIHQNDSITKSLNGIQESIQNIGFYIDQMDEYSTYESCTKLNSNYLDYKSIFQSKSTIDAVLVSEWNKFASKYDITDRTLYSILETYEKLAKITGQNKEYSSKADTLIIFINSVHSIMLETLSLLIAHNETWKELINTQNEILSKFGSSGISVIDNKLTLFFKYVSGINESSFLMDMKQYSILKSDAKDRIKQLKEKTK